jgi:hypothetical protein
MPLNTLKWLYVIDGKSSRTEEDTATLWHVGAVCSYTSRHAYPLHTPELLGIIV